MRYGETNELFFYLFLGYALKLIFLKQDIIQIKKNLLEYLIKKKKRLFVDIVEVSNLFDYF